MTTPTNWLLAAVMAIAMAASFHLDGPADHQADWADSDAIKALQVTEAGTARRNAAAQRVCAQARGPNSEARWTADGDLVCTTRRGTTPTTAVQQAQL